MSHETIQIETDERGVATLTLNLPDKHNALAPRMIAELHQAADALGDDDNVRVVVLTGAIEHKPDLYSGILKRRPNRPPAGGWRPEARAADIWTAPRRSCYRRSTQRKRGRTGRGCSRSPAKV